MLLRNDMVHAHCRSDPASSARACMRGAPHQLGTGSGRRADRQAAELRHEGRPMADGTDERLEPIEPMECGAHPQLVLP